MRLGVGDRRRVVAGLAAALATIADTSFASGSAGSGTMTDAYAQAPWYRDRPEPETEIRGRLVPADEPPGPAGRGGLRHRIVTADRTIPVYDPERLPLLTDLAGRDVLLRGRLVDLSDEGFGVELWIGRIGSR